MDLGETIDDVQQVLHLFLNNHYNEARTRVEPEYACIHFHF